MNALVWIWRTWVAPAAVCRLAAAGQAPVAEMTTATFVLASLAVGASHALHTGNLADGLWLALYSAAVGGFILFLQVLTLFAAARRLGWQGSVGEMFQGYAPSRAVDLVAAAALALLPPSAGWDRVQLTVQSAVLIWQWGLLLAGVRAVTGFPVARALAALVPAVLIWDVPFYLLAWFGPGGP